MQNICASTPTNGEIVDVTLLLGSNLPWGEMSSVEILTEARKALECKVGMIVQQTEVRQSEAWGFEGGVFVNQVVVCRTALEPLEVLDGCEAVERTFGRGAKTYNWREERVYEDRTLDIDILYFGNQRICNERLQVPHPKIVERPFVLELLAAIHQLTQ